MTDTTERATELEWLQWFYYAAGDVFGPAEEEVYTILQQNFKRKYGKLLPEGYDYEEEE